jgi:multidrug efflux pump subunit AcrA (membrane-fusion protein)
VVGAGAVDVTVDVPLASISKVKSGQAAQVTGAGETAADAGTVESISLLPASSTSSSASYPVTVLVPRPSAALASGSTATVSITVTTAENVITVPNSAVTTLSSGTAFVQVVKNGTATRTAIKTGAVGPTTTQVVSGLSSGERVVLADLSAALPTSDSTTSRLGSRSSGLSSSLSGGGAFAGGPSN